MLNPLNCSFRHVQTAGGKYGFGTVGGNNTVNKFSNLNSSSFMAVSREHTFKNYHSQLKKVELNPPPPGWYEPKYSCVMKRPQTNTFYHADRFKEDSL